MEVFPDEKIDTIDKQLEELKKALNRFEEEKERVLTINPSSDEKTVRPKINYAPHERKYDYERISKLEKLDEPQKITISPKINKNWLAANIEAPDIMDFYEESEMYKPNCNFSKDFASHQDKINSQFEALITIIKQDDSLDWLNARDFDYLD